MSGLWARQGSCRDHGPGTCVRVSYSHIVNAAFTHAKPFGSRFNGPERGAWYAGFSQETAGIEVVFHKSEELREINWQEKEAFLYADFLADFRGEFHDIRDDSRFAKCLDPNSYTASQKLAHELLDGDPLVSSIRVFGITEEPALRAFRPALVNNVRKGGQISVEFENAFAPPVIRYLRIAPAIPPVNPQRKPAIHALLLDVTLTIVMDIQELLERLDRHRGSFPEDLVAEVIARREEVIPRSP